MAHGTVGQYRHESIFEPQKKTTTIKLNHSFAFAQNHFAVLLADRFTNLETEVMKQLRIVWLLSVHEMHSDACTGLVYQENRNAIASKNVLV